MALKTLLLAATSLLWAASAFAQAPSTAIHGASSPTAGSVADGRDWPPRIDAIATDDNSADEDGDEDGDDDDDESDEEEAGRRGVTAHV